MKINGNILIMFRVAMKENREIINWVVPGRRLGENTDFIS